MSLKSPFLFYRLGRYCFIIILTIIFITSCSEDTPYSNPKGVSYFYEIVMKNLGNTNAPEPDIHIFVSSEGETFGASNKLKPGDERIYKKLIEKPYELEFTVVAGRDGVVIKRRTVKLTWEHYNINANWQDETLKMLNPDYMMVD